MRDDILATWRSPSDVGGSPSDVGHAQFPFGLTKSSHVSFASPNAPFAHCGDNGPLTEIGDEMQSRASPKLLQSGWDPDSEWKRCAHQSISAIRSTALCVANYPLERRTTRPEQLPCARSVLRRYSLQGEGPGGPMAYGGSRWLQRSTRVL